MSQPASGPSGEFPSLEQPASVNLFLGDDDSQVQTRNAPPEMAGLQEPASDRLMIHSLASVSFFADDYCYADGPSFKVYGQMCPVYGVAFSPDGRFIAGGDDRGAWLWEVETGRRVLHLTVGPGGPSTCVYGVTFSSDGRRVFLRSIEGGAWIGHIGTGQVQDLGGKDHSVSPDGRQALWIDRNGLAHLWDLVGDRELRRFECSQHWSDWGHAQALAPDGRRILFATAGSVSMRDLEEGCEVCRWDVSVPSSGGLSVSPDGRTALAGSSDHVLRLWDLETGVEIQRFEGHTQEVLCVAFSPDNQRILSGSVDKTVRLWDLKTKQQLACFEGHGEHVNGVAFSADGRYVLSGSSDQTMRLWVSPK